MANYYRFKVSTPLKERFITVHADNEFRAKILAKALVNKCWRQGWVLSTGEPE